ncbi:hypothetical protein NC652_003425 [Populus alba x Populus x berolinensis]|nr:hypothetical protein NC652_003425 [Populus alba x Populus x berolinensis]
MPVVIVLVMAILYSRNSASCNYEAAGIVLLILGSSLCS